MALVIIILVPCIALGILNYLYDDGYDYEDYD